MGLHYLRGLLELARGRNEEALGAFQAGERLAGLLVTPHIDGYADAGGRAAERWCGWARPNASKPPWPGWTPASAQARRCTPPWRRCGSPSDDPQAATAALAPVIDGSVPARPSDLVVGALLLEAIARDALGDPDAAGRALERALDLAEPDRWLISFLIEPAPGLLQRHAWRATAHAALITEILSLLAGTSEPAAPSGNNREACASHSARPRPASCATCRPACPRRRSPASCTCR